MLKELENLIVSRVVHYSPEPRDGADSTATAGNPDPYMAGVTSVRDKEKGVVDLVVFPPMAPSICRESVMYDPSGKPGTWRWVYVGQGEVKQSGPEAAGHNKQTPTVASTTKA